MADVLRTGALPDSVVSRTKDITDFVCPGEDLRLSTAALLSARFPFVSPYGQLRPCAPDQQTPVRPGSFAVDGGLVESSAAGPLAETLDALEPAIDSWQRRPENRGLCIAPRLIMIDHGYGLDTLGDPPPVPGQLRAPAAFFSADSAISAAAQQQAVTAFTNYRNHRGCGPDDEAVVSFSLALHPGQRAPLGWTLSQAARDEMAGQLTLGSQPLPPRRRAPVVRRRDPAAGGADGRLASGILPEPPGRPADVRGAEVLLWERAPGAPATITARTVADAVGRFDLPAPVAADRTYALCFRPGRGRRGGEPPG